MKNNLFLLLFCIGMCWMSACKTDTQSNQVDESTTSAKATTVTLRQSAEPAGLNPVLVLDGSSIQVCTYMFPLLLEYDPFTLELNPIIAKSRPQVEEITTGERAGWTKYTYEIQDAAVWDDGLPVTGADYAFTLKAIFNPHVAAAPYRGYMNLIKDVELYPALNTLPDFLFIPAINMIRKK